MKLVEVLEKSAANHGIPPTDVVKALTAARGDTPIVVVAAAPKTGSTWLTNTLATLCGLRNVRLCAGYGTNEHDLYLPALVAVNREGCVSQLHMKGTFHNMLLLKTFGIRPIVLVRNIGDIASSLLEDLRAKESKAGYARGQNGYSFLWLDQNSRDADDEALLDRIVDLAMPWYVNFFVSWYRLEQQGLVAPHWLTYEALMADRREQLRQVLESLRLKPLVTMTDELLEHRYGTWRDPNQERVRLDDAQRERLRRLFAYYPDVDFAPLGIGR